MPRHGLTSKLHATDVLIISFFGFLTGLNLLFASRIPHWHLLVGINIGVVTCILALAVARHATGSRILAFAHDWYVAPMVFFSFKEIYYMVRPIHLGRDYDTELIAIDRMIFGVDPTVWLAQCSHLLVTEILQIAYTSFFLLFLILGYELYRRRNLELFRFYVFTCTYGFYLSYLGYFLLPAVGPRFTLHDFSLLDRELPGLWLTPHLRWFVNVGESIPIGVSNAEAIAGSQRDVFPSGHTMLMLVMMFFGIRYRLRVRHLLNVTGILLIMATVYQRYHYVIDLAGGAAFAILCIASAPALYMLIRGRLHTMENPDRLE
jgi:membrane-associated phospholipid phosphatase